MHFKGNWLAARPDLPSRKLWTALHALNRYLSGQSSWLANYAGIRGAGLLLQVRCAVYNGTPGHAQSRSGQRFEPAVAQHPQLALAA